MNSDTYTFTCKQFKNHLKLEEKTIRSRLPIALITNLILFTEINALRYNIKRKNPRRKKEGNCLFFLD